jgi:hypothetical protein
MRASGEYIFEYVKTRNSGGVGSASILRWDSVALRVTDLDESQQKALNYIPQYQEREPLNTGGTVFSKANKDDLLNIMNL